MSNTDFFPSDFSDSSDFSNVIELRRKNLDQVASMMLKDEDSGGFPPILKTIDQRYLRQCGCHGLHDPIDVFNETYDRAVKLIESGKDIPNIPAWFRSTSFNVVREWGRADQRQDAIEERATEVYKLRETQIPLDASAMLEEFKKLSYLEQRILVLKARGLTWSEVAQQLVIEQLCEDEPQLVKRITKQASRARRKLRGG